LRLVESPLHRLGEVIGDFGARDGRQVEVILQVDGHVDDEGVRVAAAEAKESGEKET
jgi:hypothetical protein